MADRCVSCGAILPDGAKLCTSCGKIVTKNTKLRTEQPAAVRKPAPTVQTDSRVYSHKPAPTAVMEVNDPEHDEQTIRRPVKRPPPQSSRKKSRKKAKQHSKAKAVIAFLVLLIVLMLLLYMLIYMLKVREAKAISYTSDTNIKMSYSTYGEAADNFFDEADWEYDIFSGEVSVSGKNKGTFYKFVFDNGNVAYIIVGEDKFDDKKTIDILEQRMFI